LLDYLDERLDPAQAKALGPKIEQSTAARQVIKRIREVISRRDLTIPPRARREGAAAVDPNAIAEYLDGVLSPERSIEIEEVCLASNRYLAEIATCHQILGLARRERVVADPKIFRRISGLVKDAKPVQAEPVPAVLASPGVPARIPRRRLLAGVVGALIVIGLFVAGTYYLARNWLLNSVGEPTPEDSVLEPQAKSNFPRDSLRERAESVAKPERPIPGIPPVPVTSDSPTSKGKEGREVAEEKKNDSVLGKSLPTKGIPNVLLKRRNDSQPWEVLPAGTPVAAEDQLLCLPGFSSELDLKAGIRLRLQGNLPDDTPFLETAVKLQRTPGVALELTLLRGRVAIASHKAKSSVRIHFLEEAWDLEMKEPETEVALEVWSVYPPGFPFHKGLPPEEPMAGLNLIVRKGKVRLKIRYDAYDLQPPPGPCSFTWNNIGPLPRQAKSLTKLPLWTTFPASVPDEARQLLDELQKRLESKNSLESVFQGTLHDADHFARMVAVFDLAAVDSLTPLLDTWADPKQPAGIRHSVTAALRHWMGRSADHDWRLYQALEKKHSPETAEAVMILLHGISAKQAQEPGTYQALIGWLKHDLLPLRELAFAQLFALVPEGRKISFDPAGNADQRERAFQEWKKLIPDGQLPPKNPVKSDTKS
jgi:hypothetical protein